MYICGIMEPTKKVEQGIANSIKGTANKSEKVLNFKNHFYIILLSQKIAKGATGAQNMTNL